MKPSDELAKRFNEHDRSSEETRRRVENLRSSIKVGVYAALTIRGRQSCGRRIDVFDPKSTKRGSATFRTSTK